MDFYKARKDAKRFIMQSIYEGKYTRHELLLRLELKYGFGKVFLNRCLEGLSIEEDEKRNLRIRRFNTNEKNSNL